VLPTAPTLDPLAVDPTATILSVSALDALAEGYTMAPGQVAVRLSLEVAADAPAGHGLSFRVQRSTAVNVAPDLVRVAIPDAPPPPDHYAFIADDTTNELALDYYTGGIPGERFAAAEPPYLIEGTPPAAIPIRSSSSVGPESVAWRAGGPGSTEAPRLHVLDSADSNLKTWNPASGFDCSPAVLGLAARLWWVEFQIGTTAGNHTIRIWSAPADLDSPTEELSTTFPNPTSEPHAAICPRITEDHFYFGWTLEGDGTTYTDYQFPVGGGSLVDRTADWAAGHAGVGIGASPDYQHVGSHGVLAGEGNGCSYVLANTVWHQHLDGSPPVLAFPISEAWPFGDPLQVNLSVDWLPGIGTLAYSRFDDLALRGPLVAAEDETPLESIYVGSATGTYPDGYFFREP
jgi:hypothetical protein